MGNISDTFAGSVTASVVSHGHGGMVSDLVEQLRQFQEIGNIIVTRNIPEVLVIQPSSGVRVVNNPFPRGYGANHNAAFSFCETEFFCVLNPDIVFKENPFPGLLRCLHESGAALAAPLIYSPAGQLEDSIRHFPTFRSILRKVILSDRRRYPMGLDQAKIFPDWVAGMFMLFRSKDYVSLNGFDETYFLYYEDVDICKRAWLMGKRVVVCPSVFAVHDARRASHRNLRHLCWHLAGMTRYLWRYR